MKGAPKIGGFIQLIKPSRPDPGQREKINLNFYFNTSLWCLKRFYEGLNFFKYNFLKYTGREGLRVFDQNCDNVEGKFSVSVPNNKTKWRGKEL